MSNFALFSFSFIFLIHSCFGDDCPADCAQYVYDGCNECLCDSNGQQYNCTTNQCSDFQDPYCSLCKNNLQWTTCGTCITTCETVDLDMNCITECEDQCQCPSDYPIYHNGECIQVTQCPQYMIQTTKNTLEPTNSNTNSNTKSNINTTSTNSNTPKESTLLPIETNVNTIEATNSVSSTNTPPHSSYTNTAIINTKSPNNNDNKNTNNVIDIVYTTKNTNIVTQISNTNANNNNTTNINSASDNNNQHNLFSSANVSNGVFIFIVVLIIMTIIM